jgi:hypothetical protein
VLAELPDDRRVAEAYARGVSAAEALPEYRERMGVLWEKITGGVA